MNLQDLKTVVKNVTDNDMYVILNCSPYASSNDVTPSTQKVKKLFNDISSYYQNDGHIIYEIWNEPLSNSSWTGIKNYANEIIPTIRLNAPDSIIIVPTPEWDKRVDLIIGDTLSYDNIMYSHHSYTTDVSEQNINIVKQALAAGIPIIETEWSSVPGGTPSGNYIDTAQAIAFSKFLKENNISSTYFSFELGWWSYNFVNIDKFLNWDENMPEYRLQASALFFKNNYLRNNFNLNGHLMNDNNQTNGKYYRSNEYKDKIDTVSFANTINIPNNAIVEWDLSFNQDESIIGYLTPSNKEDMYDLVISANGYINLPYDSSNLFNGLTNVTNYDFTNAKTTNVKNINYLFKNNKALETLDVSNFETNKVVGMIETFSGDSNLVNLNIDGWNPKLVEIAGAFYGCKKIQKLDLSGFNVDSVKNFEVIFFQNFELTDLNISTWQPNNVTKISAAFHQLYKIKEIDLRGFKNFADTYQYDAIFDYINKDVIIKTGNETFKNDMIAKYPTLNIQ